MLSGLLSLAALTDDLKLEGIVKKTLEDYGTVLKHDPVSAATLTAVFLREQRGIVTVTSSKVHLRKAREQIEKIDYPFVLTRAEDTDRYMACKISSCFADSQTIGELIKTVEAEKKRAGVAPGAVWKR